MAFTARKKIETQEVEIQDGYYRNQKKLYYVNGNELITVTEYPGIQTFGLLKEDISKDHSFPNEWEVIQEDEFTKAFNTALVQFTGLNISSERKEWNETEIAGKVIQWKLDGGQSELSDDCICDIEALIEEDTATNGVLHLTEVFRGEWRVKLASVFHNADLQREIEKHLGADSIQMLKSHYQAVGNDEEDIFFIDVNDTGYNYLNENERDEDYEKAKTILIK